MIRALLLRKKVTTEEKNREKGLMIIVATTSLPAVDRPNADRRNAARSCQNMVHTVGGKFWSFILKFLTLDVRLFSHLL